MADVRIGINSDFNDSGFKAALDAINKIQSQIKASGMAVEKSMKNANKAAKEVANIKFSKTFSVREINGLSKAMRESNKSISNMSRQLSNYNRVSREATIANNAQKRALAGTRAARDLYNKSILQGAKGADTLARSNKTLAQAQKEYDDAVKKNNKSRAEATKGIKEYAQAEKDLAKIRKVNDSLGKAAPKESRDRQRLLEDYINDNKKAQNSFKATLAASKATAKSLEQVRRNLSKGMTDNTALKQIQKENAAIIKEEEQAQKKMDALVQRQKQAEAKRQQQEEKSRQQYAARINKLREQARAAQERDDKRAADAAIRASEKAVKELERAEAKELKAREVATAKDERAKAAELKKAEDYSNRMAALRSKEYNKEAQAEAKLSQQKSAARGQLISNVGTGAINGLTSATMAAANAMLKLASAARTAAASLLNGVARAATTVSNLLARIGNVGSNGLTKLRNSLMLTGKQALTFGKNMQQGMTQGGNSLERSAAGWSLLMAGRTLGQTGRGILSGGALGMDKYMEYEQYANRAAISGGENADMGLINKLVTGMARGSFGDTPVRNLSLSDMAQGSYYLSSAVGLKMNESNLGDVSKMLNPLLQVAGYTMTSPETMIKGALNIAQEFGINPSQKNAQGGLTNSGLIGNIGSTMGLLANESTMEIPDIVESFKMMGPMMNRVTGGSGQENMAEAMAWTYFASNAGLRGSQIGRSLDMFTSRLLDPTGPAMTAASEAFGIEDSENGWRKFFFDQNGDLKGGLGGAISKFSGLADTNPAMQDALIAQMFPQNAQRGLLGVMAGMDASKFNWEEFVGLVEIGKATEAQAMLDDAIMKTNLTISSASQNTQNAWDTMSMSIIESIKGPMIQGLDALANVFFELSDIFTDFPEIGQLFAGIAGSIGIVLTLAGAILSLIGVILVLQRALLFTQGTAGLLGALFSGMAPMILTAIPALIGMAAALVLLKTAWDANLFGMQDFAKFIQSGNISEWFATDLMPKLSGTIMALNKFKTAFTELINGIFLGVGGTNNLGAFLMDFFGDFLGGAMYVKLLQLQNFMKGVRESISEFFSSMNAGSGLKNAMYSLQGFFELLFMGITSLRNLEAMNNLGDALGIDNLADKFVNATDRIRGVIQNLITELTPAFDSIKASLSEIFDGDMLDGLGEFVQGFAEGFGAAVVASIYAIGQGLAFVLEQIAGIGGRTSGIQDFIEGLTGLRLEMENIGQIAGAVFGALFVGRILAAITPLLGIVSVVAGVGLALTQLGLVAGITAIRIGLLAVAFVASGAASLLMAGPLGIITLALLAVGAAILAFIGYSFGLEAVFSVVGAAVDALQSGLSTVGDNLGTIIVAIGAAAAAFALFSTVAFISANLVPLAIVAIAIAVAALIVAMGAMLDLDFNGWFDDLVGEFSTLFEALSQTDSIDSAAEIMGAAIDYYFDSLVLKFVNGMGKLLDVAQLLGALGSLGGPFAPLGAIGSAAKLAEVALNDPLIKGAQFNADSSAARYHDLVNQANGTVPTTTSGGGGVVVTGGSPMIIVGDSTPKFIPESQYIPSNLSSGTGIPKGTAAPSYNPYDYGYAPSQQWNNNANLPWYPEAQAYLSNRSPNMGVGGEGYNTWLAQTIGGVMNTSISAGQGIPDAQLPWLVQQKPEWFEGMNNSQINSAAQSAYMGQFQMIASQPQNSFPILGSSFGSNQAMQQIQPPMWLPSKMDSVTGQPLATPRGGGTSPLTGNGAYLQTIGGDTIFPLTPANFGGPTSTIAQGIGTANGGMGAVQYLPAVPPSDAMRGSIVTNAGLGGKATKQLQIQPSAAASNEGLVQNLLDKFGITDSIGQITELLGMPEGTKPDELLRGLLSGNSPLYDGALEGLPKPLQDMFARYEREKFMRQLSPEAQIKLGPGGGLFGGGNGLLTPEEMAQAIADEAERAEELKVNTRAFNEQLETSRFPTSLPEALQQQFNGGIRTLPEGFNLSTDTLPGGFTSGVAGLGMFGGDFLSSLPEGSSPSANMDQLMADFVGLGGGENNFLGKNFKTLLANDPGIQRFAETFGLSMDEALATVPQYIHSEELMPTVMGDLLGGIGDMGPELYSTLNDGLDINWSNLGQFAASQAEAGIGDWNLIDFLAEEWGMLPDQVASQLAPIAAGLGMTVEQFANSVGEEMFTDTQQMVNSAFGTIGLISPETYNLIGGQLQDANDKILEVTQAQFDAMATSEKQALTGAGYVFAIDVETEINLLPPTINDFGSTAIAGTNMIYDPLTGALGGANAVVKQTSEMQMVVDVTAETAAFDAAIAAIKATTISIPATIVTQLPGTGAGPMAGGTGDVPTNGMGLASLGGGDSGGIVITVTANTAAADSALAAVTSLLTTLSGTNATPTVTAGTGAATAALNAVMGLLNTVSNYNATPTVTVGGGAQSTLGSILGLLGSVNGYNAVATVTIQTIGSVPSVGAIGAGFSSQAAEGGFHRGRTLVGEEGPEIVDFGNTGAFVYTASETQSMVASLNSSNSRTSGGGGDTYIVEMNGPQYYSNEMDAKKTADIMEREFGKRNRKANRAQVPSN